MIGGGMSKEIIESFPTTKDLSEGLLNLSKKENTTGINPFSCITKDKENLQVKEDEKEIKEEGIKEEGDYWL
jgi:hypothetical protein